MNLDFLSGNLKLQDYVIVISVNSILTTIIGWWVQSRIQYTFQSKLEALKQAKSEKIEEYKLDIKKREQSLRIAELLATVREGAGDPKEINKLVWELSLWLPQNTAKELSDCLLRRAGSKDPEQILIDIRKILHGPGDDLKPENIVTYSG